MFVQYNQNTGTIRIIIYLHTSSNLGPYIHGASLEPHDKLKNVIYITDDLALRLFQTHCRVWELLATPLFFGGQSVWAQLS
jgi:hypothetical protein